MKKNIIYVLIIFLVLLIAYKAILLTKYHANKVNIDTKAIFNEILTIDSEEYDGEYISVDEIKIANYFGDYVDVNEYFKAKYDENNAVTSFYSLNSSDQYIEILDIKNFEIDTDSDDNFVSTSSSVREYLDSHSIKNDVDLLRHIKDNYYFKNTIFTSTQKVKTNYLLNSFVEITLPSFKSIILIDGDIEGYILNLSIDSDKPMKEIHMLKDNKQYVMLLAGDEITSNEFITKLLSTVKYN